jgi:hypothetical protein
MLRKWPIACLLCLAFAVAGFASAGEPESAFVPQSPAVAALLSPVALPVANPQRQLATTHVSHKHSIGSTLPASRGSFPFYITAAHLTPGTMGKFRLAACGVKNYRAPPSPRFV